MHANLLISAVLVLLCVQFVPSLAEEENATSSDVDCQTYASDCAHLCPAKCPDKNITLTIQGFVPATNDVYTSETIIPAAFAAIDDINANCSILPGYLLELEFVNTKCDPSEATWQLINSIVLPENTQEDRIMFLGGGCSLATEPLAALAGRFYKISMLSYGASSPSLSKTEMFPNFFRTIPSEVQSNSARFALMKMYNWEKVATLHETQAIFSQTVEDFHARYNVIYNRTESEDGNEDNSDLILRSFTDDPDIPLEQIKTKDIRIILGYFYEDKARATLCQAYHNELTTDAHLWMLPAWYGPDWYKEPHVVDNETRCNEEQMAEAVRYSFFLDSFNATDNPEDVYTDTGSTTTDVFKQKYQCYLKEFQNNPQTSLWTSNDSVAHAYVSFTYDGVWAMAFALEKTRQELLDTGSNLTLADFRYFNVTPELSETIQRHMMETNFRGVSGNVSFDENGDRRGLNGIYQLREKEEGSKELVLKLLAIHDPMAPVDTPINFLDGLLPLWKGEGGEPPRDRRQPLEVFLDGRLVIFCHFLTSVGILVAVCLLVFNLATLWKPLIRDSAPHINTVVIVGCIIMLVGCYLLGVDSNNPPLPQSNRLQDTEDEVVDESYIAARNSRYAIVCNVRLWVLTLGFTLSFGALFAKTWQVYRVYTNSELKKKEFKMWNFLIIMAIFLVIDVAYLIFWTVRYPFRWDDQRVIEGRDIEKIYEECMCDEYSYLIGALYVYKGLLVVFGLFLAYESRNVKYFYINDSRFVSITMYIVVILVGIGAPLSLVLAVHYFVDAAYALAILMIIAACMSCLLILFVPKFYYMAKGEDTMVSENQREEITVSDGLQLGRSTVDTMDVKTVEDEVNTLQKQVDEKSLELKELQSHVEPQIGIKPRNGSDGDSGVLVTGDENETFSTESTANGDHIRAEAGEAGPVPVPLDTDGPDECEEHAAVTSDGTNV